MTKIDKLHVLEYFWVSLVRIALVNTGSRLIGPMAALVAPIMHLPLAIRAPIDIGHFLWHGRRLSVLRSLAVREKIVELWCLSVT